MLIKPRFDDCKQCRFFRPNVASRRCISCGSGDFFEERIDDRPPRDDELMEIYAGMENNDDDA